ncbi:MAG TPA: hypothetical protein VMC84_11815 [Methanocella sp.]|uniref:hypothetical protein n=1 Tax=Methanocella sp. TaxID=2052833 RepID=UPI002C90377F|nr:hypothetical protein [Methanocella sp.]HTY91852.1 hypothetical protein [Methanocella sp.]
MEQVAETVVMQKPSSMATLQNFAALGLALLIDFSDVIPGELLFLIGLEPIWVPYDAAVTVVEAAYLSYLGVPAVKWLAMSGTDLLPIIDVIPWCTLAVLDKRFNVKVPVVTRLFNYR